MRRSAPPAPLRLPALAFPVPARPFRWLHARALPVVALALLVAGGACFRPPPPGGGPERSGERRGGRTSAGRPPELPLSETARIEAERLKALGPVNTPYENGPRLVWDDTSQRAVVETLAPAVERNGLSVRTQALVWVLVGADGRVVDAVVQTSSSSGAFDRAAMDLAQKLRFWPATLGGERVPVWVIREISLLMQ